MSLIRVQASMNRMGNVLVTPVDPTWQQAFAAHVSAFTGRPVDDETAVFFQDSNAAHEFMHHDVPVRFAAYFPMAGPSNLTLIPGSSAIGMATTPIQWPSAAD